MRNARLPLGRLLPEKFGKADQALEPSLMQRSPWNSSFTDSLDLAKQGDAVLEVASFWWTVKGVHNECLLHIQTVLVA